MLDKAITIAIMLFIMSMISERVVTWFKLYFGKPGKSLWRFSSATEDITIKKDDPVEEKRREQKILGLNIIISIFVAGISNANLFEIFNNDSPYTAIGWNNVGNISFGASAIAALGCIFTGFFISLGSKFWHDLLDMLFYAKNLKAIQSDPTTYKQNSIAGLDKYIDMRLQQMNAVVEDSYKKNASETNSKPDGPSAEGPIN